MTADLNEVGKKAHKKKSKYSLKPVANWIPQSNEIVTEESSTLVKNLAKFPFKKQTSKGDEIVLVDHTGEILESSEKQLQSKRTHKKTKQPKQYLPKYLSDPNRHEKYEVERASPSSINARQFQIKDLSNILIGKTKSTKELEIQNRLKTFPTKEITLVKDKNSGFGFLTESEKPLLIAFVYPGKNYTIYYLNGFGECDESAQNVHLNKCTFSNVLKIDQKRNGKKKIRKKYVA